MSRNSAVSARNWATVGDIALEQDQPPGAAVAQERALLGVERGPGATADEGAVMGVGTSEAASAALFAGDETVAAARLQLGAEIGRVGLGKTAERAPG